MAGIGYYIHYIHNGKFSSVGHPVRDVTIEKGWIHDIGLPGRGYGIYVDSSQVENGDSISIIKIKNMRIERTAVHLAISGDSVKDVNGMIP